MTSIGRCSPRSARLLPQVGRLHRARGPAPGPSRRSTCELRDMGRPPADRRAWARLPAARSAALAVNDEQDQAALAAERARFVKSRQ